MPSHRIAGAFTAASSHYRESVAPVSTTPLTLACWVRPTSFSTTQGLMGLCVTGAINDRATLTVLTSGVLRANVQNAAGGSNAATTETLVLNRWQFVAGTFGGNSKRIAWIGGRPSTTNTESRGVSGMTRLRIGSDYIFAGTPVYANAHIAQPCVWSEELTESELRALANGEQPDRIRPHALKAWFDFDGSSLTPSHNAKYFISPGVPWVTAPLPAIQQEDLFAEFDAPKTGWITPKDSDGWTVFNPSGDSRTIYCSSSSGSDANSGLAENLPKQTLSAAVALMRNGFPDHLYLKRGDTWIDESFGLMDGTDGGRSSTEPWVFTAYGTGARPRLRHATAKIFQSINEGVSKIAIIGIAFDAANRSTTLGNSSDPRGVHLTTTGANPYGNYVLVEDCLFDGLSTNVSINGYNYVTFRRNISLNAHNYADAAQGLFCDRIDGFIVEENVFDHNGWRVGGESAAANDAGRTIFSHNCYLTQDIKGLTFERNVSSRGSSMGLKFQPNDATHYVRNNVFVMNGYAAQLGGGAANKQVGTPGSIIYNEDNVFCETDPVPFQSLGVTVSHCRQGHFKRNIIAHKGLASSGAALSLQDGKSGWESVGVGVKDYVVQDNIVYDWRGETTVDEPTQTYLGGPLPVMSNIDFIDNDFQEPDASNTRKLVDIFDVSTAINSFAGGRYRHSAAGDPFDIDGVAKTHAQWVTDTGETGSSETNVTYTDPSRKFTAWVLAEGYANYEAFITACKLIEKGNGRPDRIAPSANDWIRTGFDLATIGGGGAWKPADEGGGGGGTAGNKPPKKSKHIVSPVAFDIVRSLIRET